jgi:alkylation response protein AidB-like acyl-CoA dehydrogenase
MYIGYTKEQQALRDELRAYYAELLTPEIQAELHKGHGVGPTMRQVVRQMGKDGWLGIGWPKEYGGQGRSAIEQFIFFDESMRARAPVPMLTVNTVGPTLMHNGTEEQKKFFLPKILAGELHFCIGYSEPGAGTDLASLKTRADRDGDDWVINGQKMWTSLADFSDYVWLAARTDQEAKKHAGISMFIVPTSAEGFGISPIMTVGGVRTNATFYDDVRVANDYLIGGLNQGWSLIVGQLNHERVSLMNVGPLRRLLDDTTEWARQTRRRDGRRVIDEPWVQHNLARVYAHVEVLRLMNWKQAAAMDHGQLNPADASAVKVFGSEFYISGYRALMEVVGSAAILGADSPGSVLQGRLESRYRSSLILTFGGGTNEVQRDIIAMAGLGLPHYKS